MASPVSIGWPETLISIFLLLLGRCDDVKGGSSHRIEPHRLVQPGDKFGVPRGFGGRRQMGAGFAKGALGPARRGGRRDIDRHRSGSGGREAEADLTAAGHFDIKMREQFGVEQRALLDTVAAVAAVERAERAEAVFSAGMELARHLRRDRMSVV